MIGAASKFAIGCELQPDALLQGHRRRYGVVLCLGERRLVDGVAAEFCPKIEKALRTQQTADVLGAERRLGQCFLDCLFLIAQA